MISRRNLSMSAVSSLEKAIKVAGAIVVLAGLWCGYSIASAKMAISSVAFETLQKKKVLEETQSAIQNEKAIPPDPSVQGLKAVDRFQGFLYESAKRRACEVSELQSTSTVVPFLTRYSLEDPKEGWGQVDIQLDLSGHLEGVTSVIRDLRECEVPLEIDSIEVTRTALAKNGRATVSAHLSLRVITKFPSQ